MAIGEASSTDRHRPIQLNHPNSALPMVPLGTLICGQPHTTPYSHPPTQLTLRMWWWFTLPPPPSGVRPIWRQHRPPAQESRRSLQVLYPSWHCRVEGRIFGLDGCQYWGWCTNVHMIWVFNTSYTWPPTDHVTRRLKQYPPIYIRHW